MPFCLLHKNPTGLGLDVLDSGSGFLSSSVIIRTNSDVYGAEKGEKERKKEGKQNPV